MCLFKNKYNVQYFWKSQLHLINSLSGNRLLINYVHFLWGTTIFLNKSTKLHDFQPEKKSINYGLEVLTTITYWWMNRIAKVIIILTIVLLHLTIITYCLKINKKKYIKRYGNENKSYNFFSVIKKVRTFDFFARSFFLNFNWIFKKIIWEEMTNLWRQWNICLINISMPKIFFFVR